MSLQEVKVGWGFFISFISGFLSFLSPCILPVIPAYLSFLAGTTYSELKVNSGVRHVVLLNTLAFIFGFTGVFVLAGFLLRQTLGLLGTQHHLQLIFNFGAGLVVITLGLHFIFNFIPFLNMEKRVHVDRRSGTLLTSLIFGASFGASWTPCIGPWLVAIFALVAQAHSIWRGVSYLIAYALGLGLPFLLCALFFALAQRVTRKIKPYMKTIKLSSGLIMIIIGLALIVFQFRGILLGISSLAYALMEWHKNNPQLSSIVFGTVFLLPGFSVAALFIKRNLKFFKRQGNFSPQPLKIFFILAFCALGVLCLARLITPALWLYDWLHFQGFESLLLH